jgi:hypothetical protein
MSHVRPLISMVTAGLLALAIAGPAAAAKPAACAGAGWVAPDVTTIQVRAADGVTFVTFEFFGEHPICLADGTQTSATISGRLWQRTGRDGAVNLRFFETLSVAGGTLDYRGNATFNAAGWHSHVRTVGTGTGTLAGITGQGTFSPIDPVTGAFSDVIFYAYH